MSISDNDVIEIPTALPGLEDGEKREKLLQSATISTETLSSEDEPEDEFETSLPPKNPKRRVLKAIAGLLIFFLLLLAGVCWFFGIGIFSVQKPQPINRSAKIEGSSGPGSEDEKLKAALSMVAAREPSSNTEIHDSDSEKAVTAAPQPTSGDTEQGNLSAAATPNDSLPAFGKTGIPESVPNDTGQSSTNRNKSEKASQQQTDAKSEPRALNNKMSRTVDGASPGRSVFFGKEEKNTDSEINKKLVPYVGERLKKDASQRALIPFGALIPIRLTSAVYTFRNSGGFIRMELTRAVEGKGYSYPAGTTLVGTLRGSEFTRAFVTVTGLIDPGSGQLVKFSGDLLGRDGASGMPGRRKKLTGAWSRVLHGLRDTGTSIIGSIGSWRSGGTVVISDSMRGAGADIPGVLSGNRNNNSDGFVQINAGSTGFVLVTDLPEDTSATEPPQTGSTASGLTDEELADLFSEISADKLRAALPKMTPEFRRLAEKAIKSIEK